MEYFVYVILSQKDGSKYIGLSANPEKRLASHNAGKTKSTQLKRPYQLIYKEKIGTLSQTREKEKWLKSGVGREWIKSNILMVPSSSG